MPYDDCVVERRVPGCDWVLFRSAGQGVYFFIAPISADHTMVPMICLRDFSRNYFKCRSVAVAMYLAFVDGVNRVGRESGG